MIDPIHKLEVAYVTTRPFSLKAARVVNFSEVHWAYIVPLHTSKLFNQRPVVKNMQQKHQITWTLKRWFKLKGYSMFVQLKWASRSRVDKKTDFWYL